MTVYKYIALSCAVPGRENDYDAWYDERHLSDVAAVPGVRSAVRFQIVSTIGDNLTVPPWRSLAIYEIETDGDPEDVLQTIRKRHGTELMPETDALERHGLLQILAGPPAK
jgi:epsilon-lactone hydrolase